MSLFPLIKFKNHELYCGVVWSSKVVTQLGISTVLYFVISSSTPFLSLYHEVKSLSRVNTGEGPFCPSGLCITIKFGTYRNPYELLFVNVFR